MLRFRNTFTAFAFDSEIFVKAEGKKMEISWQKDGYKAEFQCDFAEKSYHITGVCPDGTVSFDVE